MEAAGRAVAEAVAELAPEGPIRVVCGKGNNGGDGYVAARLLREMGFGVEALLLWPAEELRGDAAVNYERFGGELVEGDLDGRLADSGAVVDGIALEGRLEATLASDIADLASGEYVYVRVAQSDGGAAWSSPIFIGESGAR